MKRVRVKRVRVSRAKLNHLSLLISKSNVNVGKVGTERKKRQKSPEGLNLYRRRAVLIITEAI